jgi:hypothetical protein
VEQLLMVHLLRLLVLLADSCNRHFFLMDGESGLLLEVGRGGKGLSRGNLLFCVIECVESNTIKITS